MAGLSCALLVAVLLFSTIPNNLPRNEGANQTIAELTQSWPQMVQTILLLLAAIFLIEEFLFRHILVGWVYHHFGQNRDWTLLLIMITSSALFGLLHGSPIFICIQGVAGFWFAIVYLKCGGLSAKRRHGWYYATLCHAIYDTIALSVIFIILSAHPDVSP